jgi:hypothetical protein
MYWARGALGRVIVDLLYEIGGGPDGPGVTLDQLVNRAMARPPAGLFYAATISYAKYTIVRPRNRDRILTVADLVDDDGAQGTTIRDDGGKPWFTRRQAVRRFLLKYLIGKGIQSDWLTRDGDRWRLVSAENGPQLHDGSIYNAAARARFDDLDQGHAAYVTAKAVLGRIDDDARFAEALLRGVLPRDNRASYHTRRKDYNAMLRAFPKLDPDQQREILIALVAERSVEQPPKHQD